MADHGRQPDKTDLTPQSPIREIVSFVAGREECLRSNKGLVRRVRS
jgi:hypothetical protein